MRTVTVATAAILAALLSATALAGGELGQKAAKLDVAKWVKGDAVDVTKNDGKQVYVVEFWATWCGPCRVAIPHLSEMQAKYKDKGVTFIGVSTDDEDTVKNVEPFVKKMGDKMNYTVAIDNDGATSKAYMEAFEQRGIPTAFIVNQEGRVVWYDHPMGGLEDKLDLVLAGKFDLAEAKKAMKERADAERKQREMATAYRELTGKYYELVSSMGNEAQAAALGGQIFDKFKDQPGWMNGFSWEIMTKEGIRTRDYGLALKAAEAANKATDGEDASILDTLALAQFETGNKAEALKTQQKAVKLAKVQGEEELLNELNERLEKYQKAQ